MKGRRFLDNLRENILDVLDWYRVATIKQQHITMLLTGGTLGFICGRIQKKRRMRAGVYNKEFEMVAYKVDDEKEFEHHWNKISRLAQKQPGYKFTKFYKASYMDQSPIHYFKLRMWRNKDDLANFKKKEQYQLFRKKLDSTAKEVQFGTSTTIIDDSVRREIPLDPLF